MLTYSIHSEQSDLHMWGHWRAFLAVIMYSVMCRVCGLALHERVDDPSMSILLLIIRLTILSVNRIYIYFFVMLAHLSVRKLEVIMRLTTWLVSALGMCFLHRPQYRISYPNSVVIPFHAPLTLVMDLPGPLSIHVQVALAVTLGLASIPYPVIC